MSSSDPFSESFDSISIEHTRTSAASISASFEALSETRDGPGFYLLDDANGRFVIDREIGIVSLAHDNLLQLEAGAIHAVQVKVIEASGGSYELRLRLRLTGRIPQIVGSRENDTLAALAVNLSERVAAGPEPFLAWAEYTASTTKVGEVQRIWGEYAPFGTLLEAPPLAAHILEPGELSVAAIPSPASADAIWHDH